MNIYSFQVDASRRTTYEPYRGLLPIRYPLMLRDMRGVTWRIAYKSFVRFLRSIKKSENLFSIDAHYNASILYRN